MLKNYHFIDLSHDLSENAPVYPGKMPFSTTLIANYENGYRIDNIKLSAGIGTHFDSAVHLYPDKFAVHQYQLEQLISDASLISVKERASNNPNYAICAEDIMEWEKKNGTIVSGQIIIFDTGWAQFWHEPKYINMDSAKVCHFPGLSYEAAQLLVTRKIKGVGIDTLSIDCGNAKDLVAHKCLLQENLFVLENLKNLEQLPPRNFVIFALPLKIKNGSEAPARIIAMVSNKII